jgi:pyruvate-formate lyase
VAGDEAPYLHLSLLMDNCLERGKALLDGGVQYLNAASEVFGIISCADSLKKKKKLVYDEKRFSLEKLVKIIDADFDGYEAEHKQMFDAPKYGNDIDEADKMAVRVFDDIAQLTSECGERAGLHKYKIVSVNNSMSAEWGYFCGASACGRRRSAPLSNGNGPSISADKNGVTALLNSMSKFSNDNHAGVINNVRFTKELFSASFEKVKFLVLTFFENNGVQLNMCVIGKEDLKNALAHPEQYQNLIVRIGGFSARFVMLEPSVQREIIARTTYEG